MNGILAQVGIDSYTVNTNDLIEFDYVWSQESGEQTLQHLTKVEFYPK